MRVLTGNDRVTRWTRAVIVPVAIAVPLLGIATDYLTPLLLRGEAAAPWRNPSSILWGLWALLVPLVLFVESRHPLRHPTPRAAAAHAGTYLLILTSHILIALAINAPRDQIARFIWLERLPRYLVLDLVIYALILAAAYALRSHFVLRQRERSAAALEADLRRAEVDLVRHSVEPERIFRELELLREDIGHDSLRAERRLEELSDHLERQLAVIATLAHQAREPLPQPPPERRFLGLTARMWLVLGAAPFAFLIALAAIPIVASAADGTFDAARAIRTAIYPFCVLPVIVLVVAATTPRFRSVPGRAAHAVALLALCAVLSYAPDAMLMTSEAMMRGDASRMDLGVIFGSRLALLTRLFLFAVAAGVLAAQYSRRSRLREIDEALLRARLADAQLSALRMQLHPHFLFNTLNTVAGLLDDDPAAARLMTERLERFLRMSLNLGDAHEVALSEELRFVMTYLEIQRARFGDRLRVILDADESLRGARVPPLILQPLVENAIRHGIGPRKSGGTITVRAARHGDLVLTVADDGEGASELRFGIGLANTRARLGQLYGDRQSVTIRTVKGEGFMVELQLPLRFADA